MHVPSASRGSSFLFRLIRRIVYDCEEGAEASTSMVVRGGVQKAIGTVWRLRLASLTWQHLLVWDVSG